MQKSLVFFLVMLAFSGCQPIVKPSVTEQLSLGKSIGEKLQTQQCSMADLRVAENTAMGTATALCTAHCKDGKNYVLISDGKAFKAAQCTGVYAAQLALTDVV
jgi:hypothetical protein